MSALLTADSRSDVDSWAACSPKAGFPPVPTVRRSHSQMRSFVLELLAYGITCMARYLQAAICVEHECRIKYQAISLKTMNSSKMLNGLQHDRLAESPGQFRTHLNLIHSHRVFQCLCVGVHCPEFYSLLHLHIFAGQASFYNSHAVVLYPLYHSSTNQSSLIMLPDGIKQKLARQDCSWPEDRC